MLPDDKRPDGWWFADRSIWYARWGHDVVERFWAKAAVQPGADGCWLWTRSCDKDGYGKFQICLLPDRKQVHVRAHRFSFALDTGCWPTFGLMHSCDTAGCINPRHLSEGTQLENMQDKVAKGRQATGLRHGRHTCPDSFRRSQRTELSHAP